MKTVKVSLWGTLVGYLGYAPGEQKFATFEYDPGFMKSGIQLSPIHLKYPPNKFTFQNISYKSFKGVPGFITDSLPDNYGNQLIDIYMAEKGMAPTEVATLDRLNYVGNRGMGALEYKPNESLPLNRTALNLKDIADLAEMVLERKESLQKKLLSKKDRGTALSIIRIGSSAGGARSKALIALSPKGLILDGTVNHGTNYTYWLLKFDSSLNRDKDNSDPKGMPVLEYIYSLIAKNSGINIPRTDLIDDGQNRHFIIERFDRQINNGKYDKLHYCSWAGIGHADRDGVNSYEQLILLLRQINLGKDAEIEIFRRAIFNIVGRNQDDHTKNTGFLMNRKGKWFLSPAFDLTYSYDPTGRWTKNHQCWLNNKNNNFEYSDLLEFGKFCHLSKKQSIKIISQVVSAFSDFLELAEEFELPELLQKTVQNNLRLY